jgi:hypothetical protein
MELLEGLVSGLRRELVWEILSRSVVWRLNEERGGLPHA